MFCQAHVNAEETFISVFFNDDLAAYQLPKLRKFDQPYAFNVIMYRWSGRLQFYDAVSPTNYTLLRPPFVILCYDITSHISLESLSTKCLPVVNKQLNYNNN
ncbi:hypothetical protein BKA66DRAFT_469981 [Pyrenochaeta sp. MPI-SDFR-AT-0127]|nr:hypothetical protein BKA66DRAFT_469981 [Pyrenochaeta sp. MPI-SDFR-AT-0127]